MNREKLGGYLMTFIPTLYKKLIKGKTPSILSRQRMGLLFSISMDDGESMSYYSDKLMIPKSNITVIADRLIDEGYIERVYDRGDRRVIILKITKEGRECLGKQIEIMKRDMVQKLDSFTDEEVDRLNVLFEEMKAIFDKSDKRG